MLRKFSLQHDAIAYFLKDWKPGARVSDPISERAPTLAPGFHSFFTQGMRILHFAKQLTNVHGLRALSLVSPALAVADLTEFY